MTYLVTGSSGQLSRVLIGQLREAGATVLAPPEGELDLTRPEAIAAAVAALRNQARAGSATLGAGADADAGVGAGAGVVFNCAAYNQVDAAESEPGRSLAQAVNATAVEHLAAACRRHGCLLVHFSSDYVFDGRKADYYREDDPPAPLNAYGASKLAGEQAALASQAAGGQVLVLRTSWVYGPGPQNFLHKLAQWALKPEPLRVVADQLSAPTNAADLASAARAAVAAGLRGLYHCANTGYATRYEVARAFCELLPAGHPAHGKLVLPVGSDAFPTPARRPYFSALSSTRLERALQTRLRPWREALAAFLNAEFVSAPIPTLSPTGGKGRG